MTDTSVSSKVKIRVKTGEPVIISEVDRRELIFGNCEKVLYIKDLEDGLQSFIPVDDTKISTTTTWSSNKITEEFDIAGSFPDTITQTSTNSVNTTSHTHAITGFAHEQHLLVGSNHIASGLTPGHFLKATSSTQFGFVEHGLTLDDIGAPSTSLSIIAGDGLTGGGDLTGDVTISLNTPDTITSSTTNSVTLSSHTHAITGFAYDDHNHGTGTINYIPKWATTTTLENSIIYDNGTNVGIGTTDPSYLLDVNGSARITADTLATTVPSHVMVQSGSDNVLKWQSWSDFSTNISTIIVLDDYLPLVGGTMSGNIDMGGNDIDNIRKITVNDQMESIFDGGDGFAPFIVSSPYLVTNLNADMIDDYHASDLALVPSSGTTNYLVKWTGVNSLGNSVIYDDGTNVGIGTTPSYKLDVNGKISINGTQTIYNADVLGEYTGTLYIGDGGSSLVHNSDPENPDQGHYNTAVGCGSLYSNSEGYKNTAFGYNSLYFNTTGHHNISIGIQSLYSNINGDGNTAIGIQSLYSNINGDGNIAIGTSSLYYNIDGDRNTAIGHQSLNSNTEGYQNTAVGYDSLSYITTGYKNTAAGDFSGRCIANGYTANETSTYSVYLGASTKALADGDTNEIVIGYNATGLGSNTVVLGNDDIVTTALKGSVGIGTTNPGAPLDISGRVYQRDLAGSTFFGYESGISDNLADNYHAAFGYQSLYSNITGYYNSAFGYQSLYSNTEGCYNSAFGLMSLYSNTTSYYNSAFGCRSLYSNTEGSYNCVLGYKALYYNTFGSSNIAIGSNSLYSNTTGQGNVAVGTSALYKTDTGFGEGYNVGIGINALYYNTSGYRNIAIGYNAGKFLTNYMLNATSNYSIYLGVDTKGLADGDTNEIVIGYDATGLGSNTVVLGNDNITDTYLKGDVDVSGEVNAASAYFDGDCSALTFTDRCEYPSEDFDALEAIKAIKPIGKTTESWDKLDHNSLPSHLIKSVKTFEKKYEIKNTLTSEVVAEVPIQLVNNKKSIQDINELLNYVDISPELIPNLEFKYVEKEIIEKGRDLGSSVSLNSKAISELLKIVQGLQEQVAVLESQIKS